MRLWSMPKSAARLQPPPKPELPDDTLNPPPKQLRNLRMAVMVDPCTPSSCDVQAGVPNALLEMRNASRTWD
jgi:hypothetical protein